MAKKARDGEWCGGRIPYGYWLVDKKFVVKEEEAQRIRDIFSLYRHLGSVPPAIQEINRRGWRTGTIGLIADVGERLVFAARSVRQETVEKYDVEWEEAIASIANEKECPQYNGFEIKPQIGLVPIGRDRESGLWEFGHIQTGEIPDLDDEGKLILTKEIGLVFVLIPGGTFWMGAQKDDKEKPNYDPVAESNEGPVHEVTLDPFFLSKYETTQGQWERFGNENPSFYSAGSLLKKTAPGLHPVEQVSWKDCDRVLSQLGLLLPTEAQWEYAARAGTTTVWWTGDEHKSLIGAVNLADQAAKRGGATWSQIKDWPELDGGFTIHAPIGTYGANPFGLHEIHGSIWEWTRDGFAAYSTSVQEADGARLLSAARNRVYRGGSFYDPAAYARSAYRGSGTPGLRGSSLGCRPSRVTDP